jgi:UDP-glucose 4-epimerase
VIAKGAEALVHLAAGKIPRYGDALDTLVINGEGGLGVLRACKDHGVRRMVLASTSDCYGRNPDVPFSEESVSVIGGPHVRRWSYAVSKMFEEQALLAFRERYQLQGVILRLFGGYGPRQNITWWGGPQSVFIGAALKGEPLELHGTGQQTRSFTYVSDLVEGFVRAVDVPEADGEMLNIGADREITIEGLARMVWGLVRDDEPRLHKVPLATFGKYEDVQRRIPDNRRATQVLGYTPGVALEEGLPRTIAWQRDVMARAGLL